MAFSPKRANLIACLERDASNIIIWDIQTNMRQQVSSNTSVIIRVSHTAGADDFVEIPKQLQTGFSSAIGSTGAIANSTDEQEWLTLGKTRKSKYIHLLSKKIIMHVTIMFCFHSNAVRCVLA